MIIQVTYAPPDETPHIFMRYEQTDARTAYLPHQHEWGQAIFVTGYMLELDVADRRLQAPAEMAVWIPPGQRHSSYNHQQAQLHILNIATDCCSDMPEHACLLTPDAITRAIMNEFAARRLTHPQSEEEWRLCAVLIDRLRQAPIQTSFLPGSDDKFLAPILRALEAQPGDNTTLAQWAQRVFTTERTLARRFQQQLNISFSEWRQRLRFLRAIALLEQGMSVQAIAYELGYSSASALIVMFRQQAGTTPERYRNRLG